VRTIKARQIPLQIEIQKFDNIILKTFLTIEQKVPLVRKSYLKISSFRAQTSTKVWSTRNDKQQCYNILFDKPHDTDYHSLNKHIY